MYRKKIIIFLSLTVLLFTSCKDDTLYSRLESGTGKKFNRPEKTLVVYYSRTSNTKETALLFHKLLGGDIEVIVDKKKRQGFLRACIAVFESVIGVKTTIEPIKYNPENYDLVIIGSPIWVKHTTPAVRAYLDIYGKDIKAAMLFCTYETRGAKDVLREMRDMLGNAEIVAEFSFVKTKEKLPETEKVINDFFNVKSISADPVRKPN